MIVTALLDNKTQSYFNELRRLYFPPDRNFLDAHLTLFHALPVEAADFIAALTDRPCFVPPLSARVTNLMLLGGGVAYRVESPELMALRMTLAERWHSQLTTQDQNKQELHVTVQNKVEPAAARLLHEQLTAQFQPFGASIVGLGLWRYCGGPWEPIATFPPVPTPNIED